MKIRSDILRIYQSVHTWTGITTGLLLFIAFFAGALTMFEEPITQWAIPKNQHLSQVPPEKLDTLILLVANEHSKASKGFTINLAPGYSPLTWYEQGGGRGLNLNSELRHASLDENGNVVILETTQNVLGNLIDMLHRTAGIPGKAGHEEIGVLVLGVASALYFVALVSGVIFLLPTLVKSFFALRQKKGASRFWLDSHNLIGLTSLPFHLIIAWSVMVFAFHDMLYGGLSVIYGEQPLFSRTASQQEVHAISELPPIASYLDKVQLMAKNYEITQLSFSNLDTARASVGIQVVGDGEVQRAGESDVIYMQAYSQEITYSSINSDENGAYGAIVKSFFALHFGNFANNFGRWIYFILGLMGAAVFYTGNLLWLEKRRKKQAQQKASTRIMAKLTIGVCLGSILGVAVTLLSSKWLYILNQPINQSYMSIYYFVFFGAIFYSFWRGAALAAIHLQQLLALSCIGIPITTLIISVTPTLGQWAEVAPSSMVLEVCSLIFGVVFYKAAKKTKQRAFEGEENSIWFIKRATHQAQSSPAINNV